jgi:hypothetical protein
MVRPERQKDSLRPFRAPNNSVGLETQGVALGWYPAALSAPREIEWIVPWKNQ